MGRPKIKMKAERRLVTPDEAQAMLTRGGTVCGWLGCEVSYKGESAPEGWRALVVSKYSLLEPAGVLNAEVDGMLCPEHVALLMRSLKIGRMRELMKQQQ